MAGPLHAVQSPTAEEMRASQITPLLFPAVVYFQLTQLSPNSDCLRIRLSIIQVASLSHSQ